MRTRTKKIKKINFCELCGYEVPEGKEKYIEARVVCEGCYNLKRKNGNRINGTKNKRDAYMTFLLKKHFPKKLKKSLLLLKPEKVKFRGFRNSTEKYINP